jgi:acyl carrier protein
MVACINNPGMQFTREKVRADLLTLFRTHAQAGAAVTEASHLVGDLGIDSLGVMELIADIEDMFKLSIPDDALRDVDTVGSVVRAIEKRLEKAGRLAG